MRGPSRPLFMNSQTVPANSNFERSIVGLLKTFIRKGLIEVSKSVPELYEAALYVTAVGSVGQALAILGALP